MRVGIGAYVGVNVRVYAEAEIEAHATLLDSAVEDGTCVGRRAVIGANATILGGVQIGQGARVTPGAVVGKNVPPLAVVAGNPAVIIGYEGADHATEQRTHSVPERPGCLKTRVSGAWVHRLPSAADMRGQLMFGEVARHLPFEIKRLFLVYSVPNQEVRGEHAHRTLHQFLICVHGRCSILADDGTNREEFLLDDPTVGLHLEPMVWGVQYKHTPDAVLLVLASEHYDSSDYIRDYQEFLDVIQPRNAQ